jgi:hypothetical protein
MGKLHKLRRAIEKNPDKWRMARAARIYKWKGAWVCEPIHYWGYSYRAFVNKYVKWEL